jgi:hypothetical protein
MRAPLGCSAVSVAPRHLAPVRSTCEEGSSREEECCQQLQGMSNLARVAVLDASAGVPRFAEQLNQINRTEKRCDQAALLYDQAGRPTQAPGESGLAAAQQTLLGSTLCWQAQGSSLPPLLPPVPVLLPRLGRRWM